MTLIYGIWFAKNVDELSEVLQTVMGTIGTLVGSIIGYYYGESAASKGFKTNIEPKDVQNPPVQGSEIKEAPEPTESDAQLN